MYLQSVVALFRNIIDNVTWFYLNTTVPGGQPCSWLRGSLCLRFQRHPCRAPGHHLGGQGGVWGPHADLVCDPKTVWASSIPGKSKVKISWWHPWYFSVSNFSICTLAHKWWPWYQPISDSYSQLKVTLGYVAYSLSSNQHNWSRL